MANLYPFVAEMKQMLTNLDRWLGTAAEHAKSKKAEPDNFVTARLAIDQYPLVKQVQSACDSAKFAAARLTGKDPPKHPDDEKTYEELRARVTTVVAYLDTFTEKTSKAPRRARSRCRSFLAATRAHLGRTSSWASRSRTSTSTSCMRTRSFATTACRSARWTSSARRLRSSICELSARVSR